jgi:hypothetical protein
VTDVGATAAIWADHRLVLTFSSFDDHCRHQNLHPDRPSVHCKEASAPVASVPTTDVIPILSFLLFPDADHPGRFAAQFGRCGAPEVCDIDDVDLLNVKPMETIQLLSGDLVIHRRQKFEEEWQIARISFVRHMFSSKGR